MMVRYCSLIWLWSRPGTGGTAGVYKTASIDACVASYFLARARMNRNADRGTAHMSSWLLLSCILAPWLLLGCCPNEAQAPTKGRRPQRVTSRPACPCAPAARLALPPFQLSSPPLDRAQSSVSCVFTSLFSPLRPHTPGTGGTVTVSCDVELLKLIRAWFFRPHVRGFCFLPPLRSPHSPLSAGRRASRITARWTSQPRAACRPEECSQRSPCHRAPTRGARSVRPLPAGELWATSS